VLAEVGTDSAGGGGVAYVEGDAHF
jgi:hypothetical protein